MMKRSLVLILAGLLLTHLAKLRAAEFVEIGSHLAASSLSADGRVVVGRRPRDDNSQAYIWTRETGLRMLGTLAGDSRSAAYSVSADGSTVVGNSWVFGIDDEPFIWTEHGGMVGLGHPPGFERGRAAAVSADGTTIVGDLITQFPTVIQSAFRWTQEDGFVEMMPPGKIGQSFAVDVSADGSVIVGSAYTGGSAWDGFIWSEGNGFQGLGSIPQGWPSAHPHVVSADGSVVFGAENPPGAVARRAFRWTAQEGIQPIPGSSVSRPLWYVLNDATPDGSILVGSTWTGDDGGTSRASIWDDQHGTRDLRELLISEHGFADADLPTLHIATGISADAKTIIGSSSFSESQGGWAIYLDKPLVTTVAVPKLTGDFNNDGNVNAADYVVWRKGLGTVYAEIDYNTWRANFGRSATTAASIPSPFATTGPTVPEPFSATLCTFILLPWLLCVARRGHR